jgi:hypothetical protein
MVTKDAGSFDASTLLSIDLSRAEGSTGAAGQKQDGREMQARDSKAFLPISA